MESNVRVCAALKMITNKRAYIANAKVSARQPCTSKTDFDME